MRICYLSSKFPPFVGGGETITYLMAKHLSELGHKVIVITGVFDDFKPYRPQARKEKFIMKYIPGFEEYCVGHGNMIKPLSLVYKAVREFNPDVIHVHNIMPQYLLSPVADKLDTKIVLSYHNTPNPPIRIVGQFENYDLDYTFASHVFTQTKYDSLIATSDFYKQWALKLGSNQTKTHLIYSGIDSDFFNPKSKERREYFRNKLGLTEKDILVTLPSRIIKRKGIVEALHAIRLIKSKHKNIKIFLPCLFTPFDPAFSRKINDLITRLKIGQDVVKHEHHIAVNEMPSVYAATDITIVPSYYEGLGLCVLESLSMKVPVIGTNVSGITEILTDGINGLLIPARSSKKLASAIDRLITNPELSRKLVANGRKMVLKKFDSRVMARKLEKHYSQLIKK